MEEQWKDIFGYEELYQISNFGRVKSLNYNHTKKEQIMKLHKGKGGYLRVDLCKDGKVKNYQIHRLVGNAFIPNEDLFKTEINHIDENKENNNVNNLEWTDHITNMQYGTRNKRIAKSNTNNPKFSKPVNQFSLDGKFIRSFPSMHEIQREFGYDSRYIGKCCKGKRRQAYNYIWKYIEENNEEPIQIQ